MKVASDRACKLSICTESLRSLDRPHVLPLDMLVETSQLSGISFAPWARRPILAVVA